MMLGDLLRQVTVDDVMTPSDPLEAALTARETTRGGLLEALVKEARTPTFAPDTAAAE